MYPLVSKQMLIKVLQHPNIIIPSDKITEIIQIGCSRVPHVTVIDTKLILCLFLIRNNIFVLIL